MAKDIKCPCELCGGTPQLESNCTNSDYTVDFLERHTSLCEYCQKAKFHMGNFTEERFIDIISSDRYSRTMNYLASPAFDAQTMMGTLPIQHYVSIALDNHIKGIEKLKPNNGEKPLHLNFL